MVDGRIAERARAEPCSAWSQPPLCYRTQSVSKTIIVLNWELGRSRYEQRYPALRQWRGNHCYRQVYFLLTKEPSLPSGGSSASPD